MLRPPARLVLLAALALTWAAHLPGQAPPSTAAPVPPFKTAASFAGMAPCPVVRVIDGDTVVVRMDGEQKTIRLIGVDTPETVHPSRPVERFGRESSAFLRDMLTGRSVWLDLDPAAGRDPYGRMLAYVYLAPDARPVNLEIVAKGYGHAYTARPVRHLEAFRQTERSAREAGLGLWGPGSDPAVQPAAVVETDDQRGPPAAKSARSTGRSVNRVPQAVALARGTRRYPRRSMSPTPGKI